MTLGAHDPELLQSATDRLGTVLCGKYTLDAVLGIGGMATVYAATHRNHAELAVKVLHPEMCAQPRVRRRFLAEARTANSVKHRNVVKVVDDGVTDDGSAFLVMDRLDGAGVEDLCTLHGGTVGLHAAVAIVEQLLDVLDAAHAARIVHRDVKPANLFVSTDGVVKVFDFGIARTHDARAAALHLTGAGAILGTPAFMAPEQAIAGMTDIDERTDLWAAGATLFALVSGQTVHEGATLAELMMRAARNVGRSLTTVAPRAPQAIVEVVDCALAFDKSRRWASAREMRTALLAAYRFHFGRAPSRTTLQSLLHARLTRESSAPHMLSTPPPDDLFAPVVLKWPGDDREDDTLRSRPDVLEETLVAPRGTFRW